MITKSKIPKVRFAGFTEEWNESIFNEIFTNISNNTLSRAELNYNFGLAKNVHYGDVLIKFGELLDVKNEVIPFISNNDFVNKFKSAKLQNGDMIIADAAEDEIVGKCTEIVNVEEEIIFAGLHTIAIRPIQSFASKYLGYYMNSSLYHNQLLPLLQGTKVLSISKSAIKNTMIYSPTDFLEQTKIGNYFQQLDKLIEQKEKIYQKLKQFKKAMLDKIFPKNGVDVPELRFKGFSEKWEEKRLNDIMDVTSVKRIHQSDWTDTGVRFLRARDIVSNYKKEKTSDYLFITKEKYEEYSLISGKVQQGDLLVTGVGTIGIPMLIKNDNPIYFKDGNIIWFKNENKLDSLFLYYCFVNNEIQKYIKLSAGTGTVGTYTIDSGKKTPIKLPSKEEQTKIGNYFQKLDKQIDLQKKELEKLRNIKKASLDKMFV